MSTFTMSKKRNEPVHPVADSGTSNFENGSAPKKLNWKHVAFVQVGDIIGTGVLTMGKAFMNLGWVLAMIFLTLFLMMNVYVGWLLSRTRMKVPKGSSYMEMSKILIKNPIFTWCLRIFFYVYVTSCAASYVVAAADTLGETFFHWDTCTPISALISIGLMLIPLQLGSFSHARWLFWINALSIIVCVFCSVGFMISNMDYHHNITNLTIHTQIIPDELTWETFFSGIGKLCFAYLGQYIFLEMMNEMKDPSEFPKSFIISAPFQYSIYLLSGIVSYVYDGQFVQGKITEEISVVKAPALLVVATSTLYFHIIIAYLVKGTVLTRALHSSIHPATFNTYGVKGRTVWFFCSFSVAATTYLVANIIPFFDKFATLLGGLAGPILGFFMPITFFILAMRKTGTKIHYFEKIVLALIFLVAVTILIFTTIASVKGIIEEMQKSNSVGIFKCTKTNWFDKQQGLYE